MRFHIFVIMIYTNLAHRSVLLFKALHEI